MTFNEGAAEGMPSRNPSGSKTKTRPGRERKNLRTLLRQAARRRRRAPIANVPVPAGEA